MVSTGCMSTCIECLLASSNFQDAIADLFWFDFMCPVYSLIVYIYMFIDVTIFRPAFHITG